MKLTNHRKYLLEICEKVDRDLTSPTCKKLREHLAKCPDCAAYYDSLRKTIILYRNYNVEYEGSCSEKILAQLDIDASLRKSITDTATRPKHLNRHSKRSSY
jgi:predicted anti-sigma-YlaC factor YlaD